MELGKTNVCFSFNKTSSKMAVPVTTAFNTEEPENQELPPTRPFTLMDSIEEEKRIMNLQYVWKEVYFIYLF